MKYSRELLCEIKYKNNNEEEEIFSLLDSMEKNPIVDLFNSVGGKGRFLLLGKGGSGKSTIIEILRLHLLKEKISYYYFNLKNIHSLENIKSIRNETNSIINGIKSASNYGKKLVVLFDSYDEISKDIVPNLNGVLNSLYIEEKVSFFILGSRVQPDFLKKEDNLQFIELLPYSQQKIEGILGEKFSYERIGKELLDTPFCMKLFLDIKDDLMSDNVIKNEADLIFKFLIKHCEDKRKESLGIKKLSDESINEIKNKICDYLYYVGDLSVNWTNSFGNEPSYNGDGSIVSALKGIVEIRKDNDWYNIFKENKYFIKASHEKYISFCCAYYLYIEISKSNICISLIYDDIHNSREISSYINQLIRNYNDKRVIDIIQSRFGSISLDVYYILDVYNSVCECWHLVHVNDQIRQDMEHISSSKGWSSLDGDNLYLLIEYRSFINRAFRSSDWCLDDELKKQKSLMPDLEKSVEKIIYCAKNSSLYFEKELSNSETFGNIWQDQIKRIIKMNINWSLQDAIIEAAKEAVIVELTGQSSKMRSLSIRILVELVNYTEEEYNNLKAQIWG